MKTWILAIFCIALTSMGAQSHGADDARQSEAEAEAAITKLAEAYVAAFNKGDAKALGAMFAEEVEYTDEDGAITNGRAAVEALLERSFVRNAGAQMTIQIESVRTLAPEVAVERGTTVVTSRDGVQQTSAYKAVHVRKDGKWHIHELIESPAPAATPGEMLSELGWLVGTWEEKDGDAKIETKGEWAKGGNFLTRSFTVKVQDDVSLQGWQIIGWDAADQKIRSWMFDSEGAFQEGEWTRTGNDWTIRQNGVLPDGQRLSSENTLQRMGDDKCSWESMNRTLDGDPLPNLPRIEITKVQAK